LFPATSPYTESGAGLPPQASLKHHNVKKWAIHGMSPLRGDLASSAPTSTSGCAGWCTNRVTTLKNTDASGSNLSSTSTESDAQSFCKSVNSTPSANSARLLATQPSVRHPRCYSNRLRRARFSRNSSLSPTALFSTGAALPILTHPPPKCALCNDT
jgi:hypothetical protein